jgi:hypothetical protein
VKPLENVFLAIGGLALMIPAFYVGLQIGALVGDLIESALPSFPR